MTTAEAFNEWLRRYIDEPERFKREWQTVAEFVTAERNGAEPGYGATCAAYLAMLMDGASPILTATH